jgi:hypothetical protein
MATVVGERQSNTVAGSHACDSRTDVINHACNLVTQNDRKNREQFAVCPSHVGVADAAGHYPHSYFAMG